MTTAQTGELRLADVFPDAGPATGADPEDARRNEEAANAREPMLDARLPRNRANPNGGFGPLKKGDRLIVVSPARYHAEVAAVAPSGREAAVICRAPINQPETLPPDAAGRRGLKDNWVWKEWHQRWALVDSVNYDQVDERIQWQETHCNVVEDDRPARDRVTSEMMTQRTDGDPGSPPAVRVVRDLGAAPIPPAAEELSAVQIIREIKGLPKLHAAIALAEKRGVKVDDLGGEGRADKILDRLDGLEEKEDASGQ